MSRNPEYRFVSTDAEQVVTGLIALYEAITKTTVHQASPERLFLQWVAAVILQERVQTNYAGNQNIPSRAEGADLDALGELFYEVKRPQAQSAACTQRFHISQAQSTAILIPAGTRVTDSKKLLVWETVQDAYILIGETWTDVPIRCQTPGVVGNGFGAGAINAIVDLYDYYSGCENVTDSDGGADRMEDDAYYALMRESMDSHSTAGALGGYVYHAKKVSSEIADVVPNSPAPGYVYLYVLVNGGTAATEEMKSAVLAACNPDEVRAMTDFVQMGDPERVPYDIDLTYYIPTNSSTSAAQIEQAAARAVEEYKAWQSAKMGRDINPSRLVQLLMQAGVKWVELRSPSFTRLRDGRLIPGKKYEFADTVPQVAEMRGINLINGGFEDE